MHEHFKNITDMLAVFFDEQQCTNHFAAIRFKNGLHCPHCGSSRKIHKFSDSIRYKCADCRKQFTAKVGTIFEESKVSLQKWYIAFFLATSCENGISSLQLSKEIDVTQKTAWFMVQRIRQISQTKSFNALWDTQHINQKI